MSATASPGRTWIILAPECRLPLLAAAASTRFFHGCNRIGRLSSVARVSASSVDAHYGNEDDSCNQRYIKHGPYRRLDCLVALGAAAPALAQVEKVAIRTTGISCGVCAAVSEVNFKRLPGIDKVKISLSQEAIMLTYKPGATFSPRQLRDVLKPSEVGVVQFQIGARGRIQELGGKRFFIAGKDKFLVTPGPQSPAIPLGAIVAIEGILNDYFEPMELKILSFQQ
jgi:copper chaperone CopZ